MKPALKILFLAAEAAPFVKVGGLGDVAGTLPRALRSLGVDVRLALPLHHQVDGEQFNLRHILSLVVPSSGERVPAEVFETDLDGLPVYLIDSPLLPASGPVYASQAAVDGPKFVHFSLAALAMAGALAWAPDVLHAQDWHTAPAIYALGLRRETDAFWTKTASLLTVHNMPYHGDGAAQALADFGLPPAVGSALPWWAQNRPLGLGLLAADHVNTVSPAYAAEMLTEEFGAGLHDFLRIHKAGRLSGILNGLDLDDWNPETDPALAQPYGRDTLALKKANKAALQTELGLPPEPGTMLLGIVSRMDEQKGIDIALDALRQSVDIPWQAVVLGTGNPAIEESARALAGELPGRVHVEIDFNEGLGRRIYAGADAFLIPSRYEPCGLTQMISMRYGTVPIAHAVGGLKDTISDYDAGPTSTGFLFQQASAKAMSAALRRALVVFADGRRWRGLQQRGMKQDFSWTSSAKTYLALYAALVERRQGK